MWLLLGRLHHDVLSVLYFISFKTLLTWKLSFKWTNLFLSLSIHYQIYFIPIRVYGTKPNRKEAWLQLSYSWKTSLMGFNLKKFPEAGKNEASKGKELTHLIKPSQSCQNQQRQISSSCAHQSAPLSITSLYNQTSLFKALVYNNALHTPDYETEPLKQLKGNYSAYAKELLSFEKDIKHISARLFSPTPEPPAGRNTYRTALWKWTPPPSFWCTVNVCLVFTSCKCLCLNVCTMCVQLGYLMGSVCF